MRESDTENRGSRRCPELYDRLGKGQYERKKNSRGTKAWPCETCTEPWLWAGKRIRWSSSGAITRQHRSVVALPHRLRVCRPRLSNQGAAFCFKKRSVLRCLMQRAAMTIAAHWVGTCTALRFPGQRFPSVRRADPYGSTRPRTQTLQSRSCILHILFHWGKEHNRRFRAFLSIVQRKLSKSLTRPIPLSKEVLQTVCAFRFIAPNNFLVRQSEAIGSRKSRWPALS